MEDDEPDPDPRVGKKEADDTRTRVGKFVCPMAYVNVFTPMEFEEIAHMFTTYDEDESGELDMNELRQLMLESDMEYDDENVRLLLEEVDEDKSGLIDFEEFCGFLARVKSGDSKLKGFVGMTEILNTTSVGVLQEQCVRRNLKASYEIIEVHAATAISPHKHYVMEVRLEGEWVEPSSDKGAVRSVGVRRFQGIGKSTREGRMAAAETALGKLRSLMPGIEVPHGELPEEWMRWLKDNAKQGVELNRLLAQLRSKGFAPFANPEVMQWALATGSLDRLVETHPAGSPTVDGARELRPEWRAWVDRCLSIGLDGAVIVEVMQERGVSTLTMEGYAQRLRRGEGAKGADPVYPRLLDFWQCCESGFLFEVELYLSAGQPPDAPALHLPRGAVSLPLALAAAKGHCEVVDALASRNVDVEASDLMGRTALHHAAKHGEVEACRRLLEYNATLNAKDTVGCTPLHMAARYNSAQCCELLAFHGEETVRHVVSDRIPVADRPVTKIMDDAFHLLIKQRLRSNETHRFRKAWIHDAVIWCRNQLHPSKQSLLQEPSRELVDYVVGRFDPDPDAGFWQLNVGSFPTFVPSVAEPWHLAEMFRHIFRLAVCGSRDDRGWSALYQACMENRVCSHEETIRVLIEFHQFDLFQTDRNGKLAVQLLFDFEGGRPNTPSGSREKEGLLMDKRKDILAEDRKQQDLEDEELKERGRVETLLKTRRKAVDMDPELWRATQEASLHLRTLGGWMEYVDPETLNRFFYRNELVLKEPEGGKGGEGGKAKTRALAQLLPGQDSSAESPPAGDDAGLHAAAGAAPAHGAASGERKNALKSKGGGSKTGADGDEIVEEESIDHFQWHTPEEFAKEEALLLGWASVINNSEFVRTHSGRYNSVLNKRTGTVFYVDTSNEACLLTVPQQATLMWAFEHSQGTGRVLGQHREWEVRIDQDGNEFYCFENVQRVRKGRVMEELLTRDLRWDRPVEATLPVDLTAGNYALCTMDVAGYERAEQPWYICQECDEEWKGEMEMFRVCVACARNCHKGRLGHRTRFCKLSNTRCMCCERGEGSCLYFSKKEEVVASSHEKRCTAADEKAYLDLVGALDGVSPLGLAYVPDQWPDGRPKDVRGWQGLFFWRAGRVVRVVSDDWYLVRLHGRAAEQDLADDQELPKSGPLDWEFQKDRLCMAGAPVFYYHEERRECTWDPPIEVLQGNPQLAKARAQETQETAAAAAPPGLAEQPGTSGADEDKDEEPKDREEADGDVPGIEEGSGDTTGLEIVVIPSTAEEGASFDAGDNFDDSVGGAPPKGSKMFQCGYPSLCLDEWEGLRRAARVVCIRGRYTTYLDRETSSLFYHDEVMAARDKLVLMVQRRWRRRMRLRPHTATPVRLQTEAFSFSPPEELAERMKLCTAWAYLRRGARLVREVQDKDDDQWEEYQDRTTGLYFYCCPVLMKSSFHPPDLPPPSADESNSKSRLKAGDVVAFTFRGDTTPSTAKVAKVRETRTKTDAGDTVVTVHYDVAESETAAASPATGPPAGPDAVPGNSKAGVLALGGGRGLEKSLPGALRTERWVKRQELTRAPKSAEEIALDDKEAAWKHELTLAKARRQKDLSKKAEESYRAERLRKRGPAGVLIGRRERGRTELQAAERSKKRAATEKALRDDDARLALIEAQKASQELLAAKTRLAKKGHKKNRRRPDKHEKSTEALTSSHRQEQDHPNNASTSPGGGGPAVVPALANAGGERAKDGLVVLADGDLGGDIDNVEEPQRRGGDCDRVAMRAGALRESLRRSEDKMTTPRTVNRRRLIRMVHMAMVRQADGFVVCEWGCRAWVRRGQEKFFHETEQCCKRVLPCELGCGLRMREEEWLSPSLAVPTVPCQQHHEEAECPRRLVPCSQRCGEWLPFEDLPQHVKVYCVKRPFPPVKCRLGCGEEFHGGLHRMLQSEEERVDHEHELCQHRLLHCVWEGCEEMVMAKDRRRHREEHVIKTGVFLFTVPGKYTYKVPAGCRNLKVQAWGAGGGSGHFSGGQCGDGGGGSFAEAILYVTPEEELEITVGGGGSAGVYGTEVEVPGGIDQFGKAVFDIVDQHGVAEGGWPGGGAGHGGNPHWAAGGGGGCSMVAKKISSYGGGRSEPLVVAGAGGGGGSRAGVPGGGLDGEIPGTKMDMRNGRMGTATSGGEAGDSGDINGCTFPPEHGRAWGGGNGGQYGGGGGSGWFGGGGGGTSPGIVGGGGGGSSFVNAALAVDLVILQGIADRPGGTDRTPPRARGFSETDIVEGICGEGGKAGPRELSPGSNGAVRIHKPGFFEKHLAHN